MDDYNYGYFEHELAGGTSAEGWCDDCHGYEHMPWCPSYKARSTPTATPLSDGKSAEPETWVTHNFDRKHRKGEACGQCDWIDRANRQLEGMMAKTEYELAMRVCLDCGGSGKQGDKQCVYCGGSGRVETYESRQHAAAREEWRVERDPIHGCSVVTKGRIVAANIYRPEDADQIASDHAAAALVPGLVEAAEAALQAFRYMRDKDPQHWDYHVTPKICTAWDKLRAVINDAKGGQQQ
jgi:hypothetical protein